MQSLGILHRNYNVPVARERFASILYRKPTNDYTSNVNIHNKQNKKIRKYGQNDIVTKNELFKTPSSTFDYYMNAQKNHTRKKSQNSYITENKEINDISLIDWAKSALYKKIKNKEPSDICINNSEAFYEFDLDQSINLLISEDGENIPIKEIKKIHNKAVITLRQLVAELSLEQQFKSLYTKYEIVLQFLIIDNNTKYH